MSNALSPQLIAQLYAQESDDPFLILVTLSHEDFEEDICLVNNPVPIVSRGVTFNSFPMNIRLPADDGESTREFNIDFDNVGLELIEEIRTVTTSISVKIEMVLASIPDDVQISQGELLIQSLSYNKSVISAKIILDNFLNVEVTSERYFPKNFPGLF